jgi:hypothetical protein
MAAVSLPSCGPAVPRAGFELSSNQKSTPCRWWRWWEGWREGRLEQRGSQLQRPEDAQRRCVGSARPPRPLRLRRLRQCLHPPHPHPPVLPTAGRGGGSVHNRLGGGGGANQNQNTFGALANTRCAARPGAGCPPAGPRRLPTRARASHTPGHALARRGSPPPPLPRGGGSSADNDPRTVRPWAAACPSSSRRAPRASRAPRSQRPSSGPARAACPGAGPASSRPLERPRRPWWPCTRRPAPALCTRRRAAAAPRPPAPCR